MNKIYAIYKYDGYFCDELETLMGYSSKDEDSIKNYINKMNEPHDLEMDEYYRCERCGEYNEDDIYEQFELIRYKETYPFASVKEDRNGIYCENERHNQYCVDSPSYSYRELSEVRLEG